MERSREFVEGLRRELPVWQAEGIVTPGAARALAARYDLEPPAAAPRPASRTTAPARSPRRPASRWCSRSPSRSSPPASATACSSRSPRSPPRSRPLRSRCAAPPSGTPPARSASRGASSSTLAAYALSFVRVADAARFQTGLASEGLLAALPPFLLAGGAVAAGLRRTDVDAHTRGEAMLLVATVVAFAAGLSLDTGNGTALVATMALAFLAVGRIVRGISFGARGAFVEGIALAALIVASRAFDVFPSPWIAIGIGRRLPGRGRRRRDRVRPPPSPRARARQHRLTAALPRGAPDGGVRRSTPRRRSYRTGAVARTAPAESTTRTSRSPSRGSATRRHGLVTTCASTAPGAGSSSVHRERRDAALHLRPGRRERDRVAGGRALAHRHQHHALLREVHREGLRRGEPERPAGARAPRAAPPRSRASGRRSSWPTRRTARPSGRPAPARRARARSPTMRAP